MQYNKPEFIRRIEGLDGGYTTVAEKYGATAVTIHKMVNKTRKPRLKTVKKLIRAIIDAEEEQGIPSGKHPEFFLS